jgi:hypothetical protein
MPGTSLPRVEEVGLEQTELVPRIGSHRMSEERPIGLLPIPLCFGPLEAMAGPWTVEDMHQFRVGLAFGGAVGSVLLLVALLLLAMTDAF